MRHLNINHIYIINKIQALFYFIFQNQSANRAELSINQPYHLHLPISQINIVNIAMLIISQIDWKKGRSRSVNF